MRHTLRVLVVLMACAVLTLGMRAGPEERTGEELAERMGQRCQALLEQAVGRGKVHVQVTVEMGDVKRDTTVNSVGPERVLVGLQLKTESYSGDKSGPQMSDDPGDRGGLQMSEDPGAEATNSSGRYYNGTSSSKWATSERREVMHSRSPIRRISAAVLLAPGADDHLVETVRSLAAGSLGIDPARGDRLEVAAP